MTVRDVNQLFERQLGEMLQAEGDFLGGMRRMRQQATDPAFRTALEEHMEQTRNHVANLRVAFRRLGKDAVAQDCPSSRGLLEDYARGVEAIPQGGEHAIGARSLVDAEAMNATEAVEGFEIGRYRALLAQARKLGKDDLVPLLEANLRDEEETLRRVEALIGRSA